MTERELEKIIIDFIDYKYDIFSDVYNYYRNRYRYQNTNTMIIYDADKT